MPISAKDGALHKDLDYVASKGLADLTREGLAPSTTDSMLEMGAESDPDSIGEDTNTPAYPMMPETGAVTAKGMKGSKSY